MTSALHPHRRFAAALSLTGVTLLSALTTSACLEPGDPYLAERDNEPPTFVGTSPQPGGTLNVDQAIVITFSEKMDPRSLRPGIWLLLDNERVPVVVEIPPEDTDLPDIALQNVPYRVSVRGEQPLLPNTEYVLVLDTVLTDTAGNQLAGPDGGLTQRALPYRTNP